MCIDLYKSKSLFELQFHSTMYQKSSTVIGKETVRLND